MHKLHSLKYIMRNYVIFEMPDVAA